MKKILFIALLLNSIFLFAQQALPDIIPPDQVSVRLAGLGAPFTTIEAGIDTLFTNPASFAFLKRRRSAARIAFSGNLNGFDSANVLNKSDKPLAFASYLYAKKSNFLDFNVTGPLSLAITDKNFAAGIFNKTLLFADGTNTLLNKFLIGEELLLTAGYGGIIYDDDTNKITLGVQMKGFFQTLSYALLKQKPYMRKAAKQNFKNLNIHLASGIGLDIGFLYKYENFFSLGFTVKDLYTPVFSAPYADFDSYKKSVPSGKTVYKALLPNISLGISIIPVQNSLWKTVSSWSFYLDYRNLLEPVFKTARNPALNIAFGTELIFHEVLSLRLGAYEAYPRGGIGLDFTYFKLDIALYAKEASNQIWKKNIPYFDISFSFEY